MSHRMPTLGVNTHTAHINTSPRFLHYGRVAEMETRLHGHRYRAAQFNGARVEIKPTCGGACKTIRNENNHEFGELVYTKAQMKWEKSITFVPNIIQYVLKILLPISAWAFTLLLFHEFGRRTCRTSQLRIIIVCTRTPPAFQRVTF